MRKWRLRRDVKPPHALHIPQRSADLTALQEAVTQLAVKLGMLMERLAQYNPVHVDTVEVGSIEFHLGSIDVDELSGELNIGLTHMIKASDREERAGDAPLHHLLRKKIGEKLKEQVTRTAVDQIVAKAKQASVDADGEKLSTRIAEVVEQIWTQEIKRVVEQAMQRQLASALKQLSADLTHRPGDDLSQQIDLAIDQVMSEQRQTEALRHELLALILNRVNQAVLRTLAMGRQTQGRG